MRIRVGGRECLAPALGMTALAKWVAWRPRSFTHTHQQHQAPYRQADNPLRRLLLFAAPLLTVGALRYSSASSRLSWRRLAGGKLSKIV